MKISNSLAICTFLLLIVVLTITIVHMNSFMKSEVKCEIGFKIINECGCFPDENYAKLFNYKGKSQEYSINFENGTK